MNANPILLQKKYARVIERFSQRKHISLDAALNFFYHSEVYQLMRDGVSDMHCMSDEYLADELEEEYNAVKKSIKLGRLCRQAAHFIQPWLKHQAFAWSWYGSVKDFSQIGLQALASVRSSSNTLFSFELQDDIAAFGDLHLHRFHILGNELLLFRRTHLNSCGIDSCIQHFKYIQANRIVDIPVHFLEKCALLDIFGISRVEIIDVAIEDSGICECVL